MRVVVFQLDNVGTVRHKQGTASHLKFGGNSEHHNGEPGEAG
jgi:hypothetical protein